MATIETVYDAGGGTYQLVPELSRAPCGPCGQASGHGPKRSQKPTSEELETHHTWEQFVLGLAYPP